MKKLLILTIAILCGTCAYSKTSNDGNEKKPVTLNRQDTTAEGCYLLSEAYFKANNADSAFYFALKSFGLFKSSGKYKRAKSNLFKFSQQHNYGKTESGMIIQRELAGIYQSLGQYDSSLLFSDHALSISRFLDESLNTGQIYTDMGTTYFYMGKFSEALNCYEKAKEMLLELNDSVQIAKLYNNMASTYKQISYYDKATYYFLESAKLKEALADTDGLAATYNNLALVYFDSDNNKMTRFFLNKAISINLHRKNKKYLAVNYTALGDLYMDLKQADSALYFYQKSLELKTEMGNKYGIVISLHCIGDAYAGLLKNEAKAEENYLKALALANEIGAESEIASLNLNLGELYIKKGKLAAAGELFRKTLDYANRESSFELIQQSCRYLTEISILAGDKAAAKDYFSQYRVSVDSLYGQEKTRAVLEMQTRFETQKKEEENILLQKTNHLQKVQIRLLFILAVIFLLLGFLIFYLYQQKSKAHRQIVRKNLEIVSTEKQMEEWRTLSRSGDHALILPAYNEIENTTLGILVKFNRLMQEEKPYLEPGLTVDDICRKISTNRSYLSQMIRDTFKQNFNAYINELRIKEARRLLSDSKNNHISIEGIGSMSGFSNKVTFHSIFKTQIGVTPSFFRNSMARSGSDVMNSL
ncbi:MAG: tetratricopeptide repeat protein [Bacteroidota bacterium]